MLNDILTVPEVAEYLRVNPQTVYRKAKAGELPVVRIGRAIRFRRAELEEWLSHDLRLATGPAAGHPHRARQTLRAVGDPRPASPVALT